MPAVPCINGDAANCRGVRPVASIASIMAGISASDAGSGTPRASSVRRLIATRLACGHITPLGCPVVPPVNRIHRSSPRRSTRGAGVVAAISVS